MNLRLGLRLGAGSGGGRASDMILVYAIPSAGTNIQLAIQANSGWFSAGQKVVIDWGDDSVKETVSATSGHTGYIGHTYASAGTYTVKISGSMTRYGRSSTSDIEGQTLLTRIDSFGKLGITSFAYAFYDCIGLMSVPKTLQDSVTNMDYMFSGCIGAAFNPDFSKWNMSSVKNMQAMFWRCRGVAFNPNVSNWDVSNVENMRYMFLSCTSGAFNPNVSNWDVSKVKNMEAMFYECSHANFKGGRGVDGLGRGIAKWKPKSLSTGATTGLSNFMLGAKAQDATYLDSILNAWAALIGDSVNPLPTKITCNFGATKYTSAGADSFALLTATVANGGAGWSIACGGLQA